MGYHCQPMGSHELPLPTRVSMGDPWATHGRPTGDRREIRESLMGEPWETHGSSWLTHRHP